MAVYGIVAEFNPLHSGHQYLIDTARAGGSTVVCAMSGNFVQRGDTAIFPKQKRAEAALRCGVDLVAELPVPWAMSTAQNFALGGVSQLAALGCDTVLFGSESGNLNLLTETAELLSSPDFPALLGEELSTGITFAAARERAAARLGGDTSVLSSPNDTLAVEYILAARRLGLPLGFRCVKRRGAGHDAVSVDPLGVSSSLLREQILNGNIGHAERYFPPALRGRFSSADASDAARLELAILSALRSRTPEELARLPDVSEGMENKLLFAIHAAASVDDLLRLLKSKRYTMARLRRLILSAYLGIDREWFGTVPPYVRVLGCSEKGEALLGKTKNGTTPVVTRVAQFSSLPDNAQRLFALEAKAGDLYALSFSPPQPCGADYKIKFLKTECLK